MAMKEIGCVPETRIDRGRVYDQSDASSGDQIDSRFQKHFKSDFHA
jgi:hypothetical protein